MSATMSIAEVSRRSGLAPPTLRYYEQRGLLQPPERTQAGYRVYDESVLARLAFILRAKLLGCSLEEIAGLMPHWDGGQCGPVQDRLRDLAAAKLDDARARITELQVFVSDLQRVVATLRSDAPEARCDADCGCLSNAAPRRVPVSSTPAPVARTPPEASSSTVECTLDTSEVPERVRDWQTLLGASPVTGPSPSAQATVSPAAGSTDAGGSANVVVTFSEPVDRTAAQAAFSVRKTSSGTRAYGSFSWNSSSTVLTFNPTYNLSAASGYTVSISTALKAAAGNRLPAAFTSTFRTG